MVTTLEIIERSVYYALLRAAISMGISVDPQDYYPLTDESIQRFNQDVSILPVYVSIFGAGNSQSKGAKQTPRIVIDSHGFYPGSIGLPKQLHEKSDEGYIGFEYPFETLDQYIDVRLTSGTQDENRTLHNILFKSLPRKGYIPQWPNPKYEKTGNIFIELVNFFNTPDLKFGIIEKVYQFSILDCVVQKIPLEDIGAPIEEINILLENLNSTLQIK